MSDAGLMTPLIAMIKLQLQAFNSLSTPELLSYAIIYCGLSLLIAYILWCFMPKQYSRDSTWGFVLLTSFNVFVPLFGVLGSLLFTLYLHRLVKHEDVEPMVTVTHLPFESKFHSAESHSYGEGGAYARLRARSIASGSRVKALLALTSIKGPNVNHILQKSLTEDLDELRLIAFGLIDNQEKEIYAHIRRMQEVLKGKGLSPNITALIKKALASFHWELCYLELVQGDMLESMLKKSRQYAQEALQLMPHDSRLWVILGRNYMRCEHYEKALQAFKKAMEFDAVSSKAAPYLADLYYRLRDFKSLSELLKQCENLKDIPTLAPVIEFWKAA